MKNYFSSAHGDPLLTNQFIALTSSGKTAFPVWAFFDLQERTALYLH